ncbi:hypothetical protein [Leucothrix arctica]|uniref:Nucleoside transporter/FeoB GTPase Gate domain-containing protein n=1 Tax=Leucothrix arctica TaxID=1481894 RepID=A0A317CKD1_9GAMM|nr:hypothetical protein [Leucothrix arctica]PWQ97903.1 hypothetical protein DKT75_05415 [Leucothrix arctica]
MQAISFLKQFFLALIQEVYNVCSTLFKVMIPAIIIIKIAQELGGVALLGQAMGPVMESVGLPDSLGLVWATTFAVNIYGGLVILADTAIEGGMTVAQATILGSLMLMAHALPVEVAIAKKAGVSIWVILLVRFGGALMFASILNQAYQYGGFLQQPVTNLLQIETSQTTDLLSWVFGQLQNLCVIILVVTCLLFVLKVLKLLGIEKVMGILLSPLLRLLGIGKEATNFAIIGITLGLSFGGGLLISEARKGHIKTRDIFTTIVLLSLVHALIEDTLLILLIGADFHGIFWWRLLFTFALMLVLTRGMALMNEATRQRWFYKSISSS